MHIYNYKNIKLNLGSGSSNIDGFINLDILPLPNIDIICDLNKNIPLQDNSVNEIYTSHTLEHIQNTVHLMEEIYRICKPNALVKIKVPYFKSIGAFKDPTHVSFFTEKTFEYFEKQRIVNKELPGYKIEANFETKNLTYIWSNKYIRYLPFKKIFFLPFFWNIARTMYVELRVIKS